MNVVKANGCGGGLLQAAPTPLLAWSPTKYKDPCACGKHSTVQSVLVVVFRIHTHLCTRFDDRMVLHSNK